MFNKLLVILLSLLLSATIFAGNKTLVKKGKKGIFFPSMATSWVSLNDKTVEINISPGVNMNDVYGSLQKWLKRSVVEKKGRKIIVTSKYSLDQLLNRLTILPIKKAKKMAVAKNDPINMINGPGKITTKVSLIEDEKVKSDNYFMGKVIIAEDSTFPSINLKIRVTKAPKNNKLGVKAGDIINAKPYLKIKDGNPDTTDSETNENMGALFLQKNDRIDAVIKGKDKKSFKLLKVETK